MGKSNGGAQEVHRAGPLKQQNKKHKSGRHKSKGMIDKLSRGRASSASTLSKRQRMKVKRNERRKQAKADRDQKVKEAVNIKKLAGSARGASISICLLPLASGVNSVVVLNHILTYCKDQITVLLKNDQCTHIRLNQGGKNLVFVTPSEGNEFWSALDTIKTCDVTLYFLPFLKELDPEIITFANAIKEQGLPTPFLAVGEDFSKSLEKQYLKTCQRTIPVDRIYNLTSQQNVWNLLRMMSVSKLTVPLSFNKRSCLFIEESRPSQHFDNNFSIEIIGTVRRQNLDPKRPVIINGTNTPWKILRIDVEPLVTAESMASSQPMNCNSEVEVPPRFLYNPDLAIGEDKEDVPEDEADMATDDELDEEMQEIEALKDFDTKLKLKRTTKKVPKGTSEYQASWLVDSESDNDGNQKDIFASDEELVSAEEDEEGSEVEADDEEFFDWEEDKHQAALAREARVEAEFPDWIDTPMETPARVRFQKYRGLQSFKTSPWDPYENLPREYSKIFQFQNYAQSYKLVAGKNSVTDGPGFIPVGQRVKILIVPEGDDLFNRKQAAVFALSRAKFMTSSLKHETKMSVVNVLLNVKEAIKNKEELVFQVGHHRFITKPILSEVSNGNKHKMLRYCQENECCVASIYAPICFPPSSVLVFKCSSSRRILTPVAHGHILSIDPSRIIVKRILLSGYPFKVHGKNAVVRFMFFNREDIQWFKPIELKTRYGRRGHIKEPLGTHGYMKCKFDGQIKSQDTVLMPLYKRVFPKLHFDTDVPPFKIY